MTETQTIRPKRKLKKRWVVLAVFLVLLLVAAGGVYAMRRTLTSPAVGKVVSTLPPATRSTQVELEQFDGKYISFVHPMTYIEQAAKPQPNPSQLESHSFISSGIVSKVLTVIITKLPSGKFDDDPSYYMRTQNSARYKMKAMVVKNETVVTFTDTSTEQYQQAAFWVHAGKLLTFTMTGVASDKPAMTAEFNDMVRSIAWR